MVKILQTLLRVPNIENSLDYTEIWQQAKNIPRHLRESMYYGATQRYEQEIPFHQVSLEFQI